MSAESKVERPSSDGIGAPQLSRLLQDSSLYLIGNLVIRAVGFLAIPFYSRFLNPAQYGLLELVELSTQTVAIALGLQAIGAALSRLFHDQETEQDERAVVSTSLMATGLLSALVTIIAVAGARPLSLLVFHNDTWVRLLQAAFIAMFFSNMIEVVLVYERIADNSRFFLKYTLVTLFATLALNILFIGCLNAGVWGFVSSKLVVTASGCIFLGVRMRRDIGWRWRGKFIPELLRFGAPLVLSSLSYFAIHFSDRFFLSSAVSLAELGRYAIAYKFAILVSALVGDSFGKSWNVTLYRYVGKADWRIKFAQIGSYFTYILFTTGLAIALFSPELLRIMVPPDYIPPPLLLPIIIASYLGREIGDFFRALMLINKRSSLVGQVAFGGAVANIALNIILIPAYGIYGAAIATFLTWFAYMVACWIIANAEHRLPVSVTAYVRIATLVTVIYALGTLTRTSSLPLQVLLDALWSAVFCLLALKVFLSAPERWALLCFVASTIARLILPGGVVGGHHGIGKQQVLVIDPDPEHGDQSGACWKLQLVDKLARSGTELLVVSDTEAIVSQWGEHAHPILVAASRSREASRSCGTIGTPVSTRLASAALDKFGQFLSPSLQPGWMTLACVAAGREVHGGTVLLTTHASDLSNLIAVTLKHWSGRPWIADTRRQPSVIQVKRFRLRSFIHQFMQRVVVNNADVLITDDTNVASLLGQSYPERLITHTGGFNAPQAKITKDSFQSHHESDLLLQVITNIQVREQSHQSTYLENVQR